MATQTPESPPFPHPVRVTVHRGLTWEDMPGRLRMDKRLRFALFRKGQWPPPCYQIPADLQGPDLAMMLEERACNVRLRTLYRKPRAVKGQNTEGASS